jgi:hypothetical protein
MARRGLRRIPHSLSSRADKGNPQDEA